MVAPSFCGILRSISLLFLGATNITWPPWPLAPIGLASASDDKSVILWDIETHRPIATLQGHSNFVNAVAFSPDGATLASGSTDHAIILWDDETRKQVGKPLMGHKDGIMSVAFSPDGK